MLQLRPNIKMGNLIQSLSLKRCIRAPHGLNGKQPFSSGEKGTKIENFSTKTIALIQFDKHQNDAS